MTIELSPYLAFNGNARQAFGFYQAVFGGELDLHEFGSMGADGGFAENAVMHAQLTAEAGWVLMGADSTLPDDEVVRGGSTVTLWGEDVDEMRSQFARLAEDGDVSTQLAQQAWGSEYGELTDKFGIAWAFVINSPAGDATS